MRNATAQCAPPTDALRATLITDLRAYVDLFEDAPDGLASNHHLNQIEEAIQSLRFLHDHGSPIAE